MWLKPDVSRLIKTWFEDVANGYRIEVMKVVHEDAGISMHFMALLGLLQQKFVSLQN